MDTETLIKEGPHKYFGIELNQMTWSLPGKPERTSEEDEMMIHSAHGSYYHWLLHESSTSKSRREDGTYITNAIKQRGEWLISHVYSVLNVPERAMYYAVRCKKITEENRHEMEDFDLAYADEAMARAHACNGDADESIKYFKSSKEKGEKIIDKEAKEIFTGDLNSEPWFGVIKNK